MIQQVRYTQPSNRPSILEAGLQGMLGGVSGYYDRQAQQQKNMMNLLPVLAQMKMLTPGGTDVKMPGTNVSFGINQPQQDYGTLVDQQRYQQLKYENEHRDEMMKDKEAIAAYTRMMSTGNVDEETANQIYWNIKRGIKTPEDAKLEADLEIEKAKAKEKLKDKSIIPPWADKAMQYTPFKGTYNAAKGLGLYKKKKPTHIPQEIWDSTTDEQKQEYYDKYGK